MSFYNSLFNFSDFVINIAWDIKHLMTKISPKRLAARKYFQYANNEGVGKDLFIVLNGPSIKNQNLSLLKGKTTMFVNRGFKHPLYAELKPRYHVFVDPKILTGVWPIDWFEEIFELSPNVRIILPAEWFSHPVLTKYKYDNRIYWIDWMVPFNSLGVSGTCFSFAILQKFEKIFFTGFDANGICHEMLKTSESHFYGGDPELKQNTTEQFALSMFAHAIHLHELNCLAKYCQKRYINIINLTDGGLLDMFPRAPFDNPYNIDD